MISSEDKNIYLFIIWNKVLWAKKRIINDLNKSFEVVKQINVKWDENKYLDNLLSLYGSKTHDGKDKLESIGKGGFCLILVKDNNEDFETVYKYDRNEYVNKNINKKKKLYRKWTGTNFRIHSSENNLETIHDLTILFGNDYINKINNTSNNETICINTKGIEGFKNKNEFIECINIIGDIVYDYDKYYVVISRKKNDVLRFINKYKEVSNNNYLISIGNKLVPVHIYGEEEGDLPDGFINIYTNNKNFKKKFNELEEIYLVEKTNSKKIQSLFSKNGLDINLEPKETIRKKEGVSLIEYSKKIIKYYLAYMANYVYLLKNRD